jgi:pyruvate/2-oxoacid:ferredoxin oxidoreductase alpha subunit
MIVNQDGLLTSHTVEGVKPLNDKDAYNFVGEYKPYNSLLDTEMLILENKEAVGHSKEEAVMILTPTARNWITSCR